MTAPDASAGNLLDAALYWAGRGAPVFPCEARGKAPLGSLVAHGLKDASTDPDVIRAWWTCCPSANVGLVTGIVADVLDVDGPEGEANLGDHDEPVDGPTQCTGGGGWHVLVKPTGHGNRAGVAGHVDWRGRGGYIVVAPSVHPSGERYRWCEPPFGPDAPIRPAPAWLIGLLGRKDRQLRSPGSARDGGADRYGRQALDAEAGRVALAPQGERNHTLCRAAFRLGQLAAAGRADTDHIVDALRAVALRVGLGEYEVDKTIESGLKAGLAHPRRMP